MNLTDSAIRSARATDRPIKLFDGQGLFLLVNAKGQRWWRLKYRFGGKEQQLSLGTYPEISLKVARERRDEHRRLIALGIDPSTKRRVEKVAQADTFEAIGREWYEKFKPKWAKSHSDKIIQRLERDVFPWLGRRPIAEILAPEILVVVRRIEDRGALDTSHRALQNCGQVFRYAIATGRAVRDPCQDLRGALPPAKHENFPSITDPEAVGELLRAIEGFKGTLVVKSALQLAPLLFQRPGELRKAQWSQFDLERGQWKFQASKNGPDHLVPLSQQAVEILRTLHSLTGRRTHVFPGRDPKKPMSDAAVNAALRRMGYDTKTEITGHGFRAMARTILDEHLQIRPEVIEHQLAHRVKDNNGTAYNRTKFLKERTEMMQVWADYLDQVKAGVEPSIPLRAAA